MIAHPCFETDPWAIRETSLDLDTLPQTESILALSNGHLGLRGNLDEGEPHGLPGTYLNGVYEVRPIPYGESAYGNPEDGQTVVDVTNGKVIRLLVEDEPFDVRYGELLSHERVLDLRAGTLRREARWRSPRGSTVVVRSVRLVSLVERAIAAIEYQVEAVESSVSLVVQSELMANEALPIPDHGDPRVAAGLASPLRAEHAAHRGTQCTLVHVTRASALRVGAAMDHEIAGPKGTEVTTLAEDDLARVTVACVLEAGQRLRIVKVLGYGWSATRSLPAVVDQVEGALAGAQQTGWDGLVTAQAEWLDDFWARADVELDGDPRVQQGLRFGMFHSVQAGVRAEHRAIPGQGPHGTRLRRPCLLGHRDVRAPAVDLHGPQGRRPGAALASFDARPRARARPSSGARGRGLPVADDSRRGVLGLLAGGHGGPPRERRHRRRGRALSGRDGGRGVRARRGPRAAGRDGPAVGVPGVPRQGGLSHRRGDRPGRVQRDRRQQRLHQPDGPEKPARGSRAGRPAARAGDRAGSGRAGAGGLASRGRRDGDPLRRGARRARASWDSSFYILDGNYTFVIGEASVAAQPGAWVFVPRNTAHAWRCDSAHGRVLNISTPGGFEEFYRQVGEPLTDRTRLPARTQPDVEALSSAAAQHGIAIVGPPPGA